MREVAFGAGGGVGARAGRGAGADAGRGHSPRHAVRARPHALPAVQRRQRSHLLHRADLPFRRLRHTVRDRHHHRGRGPDHLNRRVLAAHRASRPEDPLAAELHHHGAVPGRIGNLLQVTEGRCRVSRRRVDPAVVFGALHHFVFDGIRPDTLDDDVRTVPRRDQGDGRGDHGRSELGPSVHCYSLLPADDGRVGDLQLLLVLRCLHAGLRVLRVLPDPRDEGEVFIADPGHPGRKEDLIDQSGQFSRWKNKDCSYTC